jgi:CHAD domain-containing protein
LADLSKKFFRDLPEDGSSPEALHKFRIRSKALRYGLELVAPVLGGDLREVQYPVVVEIQERLGAINDHATAASRFEQWAGKAKAAELKSVFSELAQSERQRMEIETREFHGWWTAERVESLRSGLQANGKLDRERTVLAY